MFDFIKILIVLVILLGAVVAGIVYLPGEKMDKVRAKTRSAALKGCSGAQRFVEAMKEKLGESGSEEPSGEPAGPGE
jgi:hypothetical protein